MRKKPAIVTKVCITGTLRLILPGHSATYSCRDLGPYASVNVAVFRLNKRAGFEEYELESPDNGATYTVTRNYPRRKGA